MKKRPKKLFVTLMRLFNWGVSVAVFFALFSVKDPHLLVLNRTSVIVFLAYTIVYVLMVAVYGGFDIGTRKSRAIVFSGMLVRLFSDLAAHLFLCIMNYTVIQNGRFVYEQPLVLLGVFLLQALLLTGLAYLGNSLYFRMKKPQRCLVIVPRGCFYDDIVAKVGAFKKQYRIQKISYVGDADVFEQIDRADAVFLYDMAESERCALVAYCYERQKDIYYGMELTDVIAYTGKHVFFDDTSMVFAAADKMSVEDRSIKRVMDVVLAALGLAIASPLFLITAVCIKLEDGGDIFYRQKRATIGGRVFEIVKFRSMHQEAGDIHRSVTSGDDRVTRVGRVIRKFRVDELPQLWNVLRGDMSIVGPRPEMLENVEKYTAELPAFAYRLRAKAGLTGYAQVYGRYDTSPKDKMIMDLLYIENYSLLLDIKIILRTILIFFTPGRSTKAFEAEKAQTQDAGTAP